MNEQMRHKIATCPTLPTLPAIAMEVFELAQQREVDLSRIARRITQDPALTGKLLRTANSSFYGRPKAIATVSQALVVLGLQSVKALVLGFSLVTTLTKDRARGFDHMSYWRRSIYAATATRLLATRLGSVPQEEAFLAALLGDIGVLVLSKVLGPQYDAVHRRAADHESLRQVERDALGVDHAEVAGIIADLWKLPSLLATPMRHHHSPEQVIDPQHRRMAEIVQLGGRCADVYVDREPAMAIRDVRAAMRRQFQRSDAQADVLLAQVGAMTREAAQLFEVNLGSAVDFTAVLKGANEALVELALQTQLTSRQLAQENQQLRRRASTDALTGLANRAVFDDLLAQRFASAARHGEPLSLVMLDIDNFKCINDQYGHAAGDAVLRHLGQLLKETARQGDLAARYGGEELMLVLPGTPRAVATGIAEALRRAIAERSIPCDGVTLRVTASVGVAALEAGCGLREPGDLLKGADRAVYSAKHAGRNNVQVYAPTTTITGPSSRAA
jgi:diguanylate cyclase (GGDEF)-like protein